MSVSALKCVIKLPVLYAIPLLFQCLKSTYSVHMLLGHAHLTCVLLCFLLIVGEWQVKWKGFRISSAVGTTYAPSSSTSLHSHTYSPTLSLRGLWIRTWTSVEYILYILIQIMSCSNSVTVWIQDFSLPLHRNGRHIWICILIWVYNPKQLSFSMPVWVCTTL